MEKKEYIKSVQQNCPECSKEFTRYMSTAKVCCSKECSWKYKYRLKYPHAAEGLKNCFKCEQLKRLEEFPKLKVSVDGRRGTCSKCWDKQYPYIGQTPEKSAKDRNTRLKSLYKIDQKEYERMYNLQQGKCYICHTHASSILNIDHCHITNKVRKLLCSSCNTGLGQFKDNLENMKAAVKYLEEHQ